MYATTNVHAVIGIDEQREDELALFMNLGTALRARATIEKRKEMKTTTPLE